jgi:hypothetical protein
MTRERVMKSLLTILFVIASSVASAQQSVPTIDIGPTCRAAAAGSAGLNQDYDSCRKSEDAARDILVQQWTSFLAADRGSCYRLTTTGTPGTYTELLTCLEMKRDARKLPDGETVGQSIGN